ncbi:MAG: PHP domain-containing protein [Gemmatimonadaceae bacterium]|nr:PHP domain-containing protein [Gemmatimonadaceae bacterium]
MNQAPDAVSPAGPCVDLQVHSTASDGALPPAEVVRHAHRIGLVAMALTDHDTLAGLDEARAAAAPLGLRVIAGVELSTDWHGRELHILGLHVRETAWLEDRLRDIRDARRDRAALIVERLGALGIALTMDDVLRETHGASLGRPHIARAMIARGYVTDLRQAFDKYLGAGKPAFVEKEKLDAAAAIALLHEAGALAVWAHPGRLGTQDLVKPLAKAGLDGLEVLHPGHSPDDRARLFMLAERHALLLSGGSDWHGQFEGPRQLGNQQVPLAWLAAQDRRVAERAVPA